MFAIGLAFSLPSVFNRFGAWKWLAWMIGMNVLWSTTGQGIKVWVRLFGFCLMAEAFSVKKMQETVDTSQKMEVSETKLSKNGAKTTKNDVSVAEEGVRGSMMDWIMQMIAAGYKYVITSENIYNEQDRSFKLPRDKDGESMGIEIGDKIAFGTQLDYRGVRVVGFREGETEIVYYCEAVSKSDDLQAIANSE